LCLALDYFPTYQLLPVPPQKLQPTAGNTQVQTDGESPVDEVVAVDQQRQARPIDGLAPESGQHVLLGLLQAGLHQLEMQFCELSLEVAEQRPNDLSLPLNVVIQQNEVPNAGMTHPLSLVLIIIIGVLHCLY
jgi:hypothetical protein